MDTIQYSQKKLLMIRLIILGLVNQTPTLKVKTNSTQNKRQVLRSNNRGYNRILSKSTLMKKAANNALNVLPSFVLKAVDHSLVVIDENLLAKASSVHFARIQWIPMLNTHLSTYLMMTWQFATLIKNITKNPLLKISRSLK